MSDTPTAMPSMHGKQILVVEDEFLIQLDIQQILEGAGARSIVAASRVTDALSAIEVSQKSGKHFDAAVLDLKLDKESTIPVAERLADLRIPFVFLTGAPSTAEEVKRFHAVPVVGKPFDSATLLASLELAMAKAR